MSKLKQALTAARVESLPCEPGKKQTFHWDAKTPGLALRVTASGTRAYIFESRLFRKTIRLTIGDVRIWELGKARTEAARLKTLIDTGVDPREQRAEQEAAHAARRAAATAEAQADEHTLARLCDGYCDYLKSLGRSSHSDARSIFNLHVKEAWPQEAALPAMDVTPEQIADMMRRLFNDGKGRTANKLRSYLHAAYQVARAAKSKPSIPVAFKDFGITVNPVSDTAPDEAQNNADKNPLTPEELRTYWRIIRDEPGFKAAVLRLHLLTGSQRIAQFVRLRTQDIGQGEIMLFDGKGRPGRPPREHPVPLIEAAAKALRECEPQGEYALSTDGGETHLAPTTLSHWAVEAVGDAIPAFQAKRLRSGVETVLAKAKISSEMRGRLQSHGIAGVQARHYDGHDYVDQKLEALTALYQLLEPPARKGRRKAAADR